jgi:acetyltransferase-like isoleucine patch superfamily enzyme
VARIRKALSSAIDEFIAEGNSFSGDVSGCGRTFTLEWEGSGNRLVIGEDTKLIRGEIQFLVGGGGSIEIGSKCAVRGILRADGNSTLRLGSGTCINRDSTIRACEGGLIDIGEECLFSNVVIRNSDLHAIVDVATGKRINPSANIRIDRRVWLGEDVYVYKGSVIGEGSIIGARSVVTNAIGSRCVAVGVPAKAVREGVVWYKSLDPKKWNNPD